MQKATFKILKLPTVTSLPPALWPWSWHGAHVRVIAEPRAGRSAAIQVALSIMMPFSPHFMNSSFMVPFFVFGSKWSNWFRGAHSRFKKVQRGAEQVQRGADSEQVQRGSLRA